MKCSACGDEVRSDARFCSHCGARTKGVANTGVSPYELPWDGGQNAFDTPDFHAEDTIIPDFMPPTPAPSDTADDVFAGVADTAAPGAGAVTGNAAASTGRRRVLAAALLVLLLAAGSFYFLRGGDEALVPAPATVVAVQPADVPAQPEDQAEAGSPAKAEEIVALAPRVSTDEASAQSEVAPASPPDPVVEPAKPEPRTKPTETVQRKAAPAQPAPAARSAPARAWLAALKADLAACDAESFFPRIACREKARWKYCAPDHWNTVPECEVDSSKR
ncbi:zinc ribbon domain-containing protein [Parazoarcus communis]|nr:zinc ribbon domain-containing protein [Parazoarcus communis]